MNRENPAWLETAVIYEIYPQSFCDSNGDGIGDLRGIIQRLDYLKSLGINAIWLNPCFESPFSDAGYDISDFYKVAPRYGNNVDLKELFDEAHKRDIRVLLDLVAGHTSVEHPWFKQSSKHERNEYTDWFIWTDSVWSPRMADFDLVRGSFERNANYITNFFAFQPALNYGFANPDPRYPWQLPVNHPGPQAVRREMKNIMRYWMELGADGFRVDMAASLVKNDPGGKGVSQFWKEIRSWLDMEFPDAVIASEWSNPSQAIPAGFHMDHYIHFNVVGYTSLFRKHIDGGGNGSSKYGASFFSAAGHGNILEFLDEYLRHYDTSKELGYISIPTGNHDIVPRLSQGRTLTELEVAYIFLLTMPGVPHIYYGDEIGMRTVDGLPSKEGGFLRTGVRTPMQWDHSSNAGFSSAPAEQLYLPVDRRADRPNVADQEPDPGSLLNIVRRLIALRKQHPALNASGDFSVVYAEPGQYPFVYRREKDGENLLIALNPTDHAVDVLLPSDLSRQDPETLYGFQNAFQRTEVGWRLHLPAVSGGVYLSL
jgi:glycosidase